MLPLQIKCDKRSYLSERISQLKCIQIAQLPNSGVGYLQFLLIGGGQKAKDRRTSVKLSVTGFHCCKKLEVRPHNRGHEKPGTQAFVRGISSVSMSVNNGTGRSATTVPQWQGNEVLRPLEGDHLSHYQASTQGKMLAKGKGIQSGWWQRDLFISITASGLATAVIY